MKVEQTKEIVPVRESPRCTDRGVGVREDRVSARETEAALATVVVARQAAGTARSARLAALAEAVDRGTYRPDPSRIAQELLEDAELTAHLQALLARE